MTVVKAVVNAAKMMFSPTSVNNIQHIKAPIYFSSNISVDEMSGAVNARSSMKEVSLNSSSRFAPPENNISLPEEVEYSESNQSNQNVITEQSARE